ncbi:indole-3-acetate beta-glucosyltransferase isoform X1 [Zea mays]|uniref:Glycosyltransferase n=1 Tax=Zea mays TaxID=4577 RepID=A0A804RH64_MAIZE|nr:indole-3-acetate beta-glucosyltransferase isoform X1 [Zea mays]|eukprot:XP_023156912.1 indole-3-acetate beta-glucosyltransferase isoform X1 [Zea mays]
MGSTSATGTTSSSSSAAHGGGAAHVLLLPYPGAQGHTNPLLQFGRCLAYHGLRPTLVTSRYVLSTTPPPGEPFRVAAISDGFDDGGAAACPDLDVYWRQLEAVGSETLAELIRSEAADGRPVRVLVYDPHLPWARRVAQAAGLAAAAFLSQPCAVDVVYGEVWAGRLPLPVVDGKELFARGLLGVELGPDDVPPFAAKPDWCPVFLRASLRQFEGLEDADDVLVNSFHEIEPKLEELGNGLYNSGKPFIWVVRSNEEHKLSDELRDKCKERGLIVSWCPQLEVLAHKATGCFFTHCGWNSTLEAIVNGVPMVAIPHWADQPTISKYMESMWGLGVRVRKDEKGLVTRDEVERCIKDVMDGDSKDKYRKSATMWMQKAKSAMQNGGSSDKNITEFVAKYSLS